VILNIKDPDFTHMEGTQPCRLTVMEKVNIIHIADIKLESNTGMGRIALQWRSAAIRRGFTFVHVGSEEVGRFFHYSLFALKARRKVKASLEPNTVLLIHEPCAWAFRDFPLAKVGFSHGLERRSFKIMQGVRKVSLKAQLFQPLWTSLTLSGLRSMDLALLSNYQDRDFFLSRRVSSEVRVFRNGVNAGHYGCSDARNVNILYNASWLDRKGKDVLVKSAIELARRGYNLQWLLIGTGKSAEEVKADWPRELRDTISVVDSFAPEEEHCYLISASIFVLPSYFEGSPLSLLEAMHAGLCCITSNCCGQKDLIKHYFNGLLFEPGNAMELATMIEKAVTDRALRQRLGSNAVDTMAARSWEEVTSEVMDWIGEKVMLEEKRAFASKRQDKTC
jgi:glycosyltransferase involved in cell wall biosynthesis